MIVPTSVISEQTASGEEIHDILVKMEGAFYGVPRAHGIIACLSAAITLMMPTISPEDLTKGVSGASQWICLFLDGKGDEEVDGEVMEKRLLN